MIGSFLIQGLTVNFHCERALFPAFSAYFNSLCPGNICSGEALDLKLKTCKSPYSLPPDAVKEITGPWITYFSRRNEIYFISRDGSLISLDTVLREAKGFLTHDILKDPSNSFILVSEPLAEILKLRGLYCLHAAALCNGDISILVSGPSGCGKTTTSLSLVANGFKYVSDDTVLIEKLNDGVTVYPLYKSFNIDQDTARRFPQIFKDGYNPFPEKGKLTIEISEIIPGSHIQSAKPDVIVFPKIISGANSKIRPVGELEVYQRLLSQIILAIDKNVAKRQLNALGRLVKQTRGFELLSGKDLYENPGSIINFVDKLKNADGTC
jgi:hypothetical protein